MADLILWIVVLALAIALALAILPYLGWILLGVGFLFVLGLIYMGVESVWNAIVAKLKPRV